MNHKLTNIQQLPVCVFLRCKSLQYSLARLELHIRCAFGSSRISFMFATDKMYDGCFEDDHDRDLSGETLYATLYSGQGHNAKFHAFNSVDFCLAWCRDNGRKFLNQCEAMPTEIMTIQLPLSQIPVLVISHVLSL